MKHLIVCIFFACISQYPATELRIPFTGVIVNDVDNANLEDGIAYLKDGPQHHGMSMLSGPIQQSPLSFAKIMGDRYMGTNLMYIVSLSATVQDRTEGTSARLWDLMQDIKTGLQISTDE